VRVATSTVSRHGYQKPTHFDESLRTLTDLLSVAKIGGVQLACLPAGYFCIKSESGLNEAKNRIVSEARTAQIAIAVGIDCVERQSTDIDTLVRTQSLPSFGLAWCPEEDKINEWRQRSTTSSNQWDVPESVCERSQTFRVADKEVEILMCGELFNERIRKAVTRRRPFAIVDLSHDGRGFRPDRALELLAQRQTYSFCCTHANAKDAMKRAFAPGGRKISSRETDFFTEGKPRIEMKVWPGV
jgi:hypothetical protein